MHIMIEMERVEMRLEVGRNSAAQDIFARPMSFAEVLECSVQIVQILWEDLVHSSYLDKHKSMIVGTRHTFDVISD